MHHLTSHIHLRPKRSRLDNTSPQAPVDTAGTNNKTADPKNVDARPAGTIPANTIPGYAGFANSGSADNVPTDNTPADVQPINVEPASKDKPIELKPTNPADPSKAHPVIAHQARINLVAASKSTPAPAPSPAPVPKEVLEQQARLDRFKSHLAPTSAQGTQDHGPSMKLAVAGTPAPTTSTPLPKHVQDEQARLDRYKSHLPPAKAQGPQAHIANIKLAVAGTGAPVTVALATTTPATSIPAISAPATAPIPKEIEEEQARKDRYKLRLAAAAGSTGKPPITPAPIPPAGVAKMKMFTKKKAVAFSPTPPGAIDILRYRQHWGVNLGSIHVLERWLFPSAFPDDAPANQTSELACVEAWVDKIGIEGTRKKFEDRWATAMSDKDWNWLVDTARCTSIRLPIGYFTLGPAFCAGTAFEPYSAVYMNAWSSVKALIDKARVYGIGVLIDLHALPGGANSGEHSGTNSNKTLLWKSQTDLTLATKCLTSLARDIGSIDGVIGLQLCNEAAYGADGMYAWYDTVLSRISTIDHTIPLYISDAWDLGKAIAYIKKKNTAPLGNASPPNPMIIDTHVYYCFDDIDKSCSPAQIIARLPTALAALDGKTQNVIDTGAAAVIVGEYSCVLDPKTWALAPKNDVATTAATKKQFGNAQCETFASKCSGAYYWTLKMDWMPGGDWGFVAQTTSGAICPPKNLALTHAQVLATLGTTDAKCAALEDAAYTSHVAYWDGQAPGKTFQHAEYKRGWDLGWNDARDFFRGRSEGWCPAVGADRIGLKGVWVRKRICEVGGSGDAVWEFEQGLWKGMADFEGVAFAT